MVPTRDRPTYLARCLSVVLAQVGVDLEVIVVDDGSSRPVEANSGLKALLLDPRVSVVRHTKSRGVAAARNSGIQVANFRWVAFIDDDDFWAPEKLAAQVNAIEGTPSSCWSYTGAVILRENLTVLRLSSIPRGIDVAALLARHNAVPGGGSSVLADVRAVREVGGFDERFSILADWDLWLRLVDKSPPAVVALPLVGYVRHSRGLSVDTERSMEEFIRLQEKQLPLALDGARRFDLAMFAMYLAELEFTLGERTRALRNVARAAREGPIRVCRLLVARLSHRRTDRAARTGAACLDKYLDQWRAADRLSRDLVMTGDDHACAG